MDLWWPCCDGVARKFLVDRGTHTQDSLCRPASIGAHDEDFGKSVIADTSVCDDIQNTNVIPSEV